MTTDEMIEHDENICSNSDHEINYDVVKALMENSGKMMSCYPGWNFYGNVYYRDNQFHCEVWVHGSVSETISEDTFEELKFEVCLKYGDN